MPPPYRVHLPNCEQLQAGDYVGDDSLDQFVPSGRACAFCGGPLARLVRPTRLSLIMAVVGDRTYDAQDVPPGYALLACRACRVHFTSREVVS